MLEKRALWPGAGCVACGGENAMRGNRRQKRPEDLQGRGSRYTGTKTILLEWTPEQLAAREAAIGVAIAQVERTCGGLARTFGAGSREPVLPAKSEVAS